MQERLENNGIDNTNSISLIPFKRINQWVQLSNPKAIKRWLEENDISTYKIGSKNYVYKLDLEYNTIKPLILNIKRKKPKKWKDICRAICKDISVYNLIMLNLNEEHSHTPTTRVSLRTDEDKKLFKDLS